MINESVISNESTLIHSLLESSLYVKSNIFPVIDACNFNLVFKIWWNELEFYIYFFSCRESLYLEKEIFAVLTFI